MTIPASPPGSRDPVDSASPNVAGHASADENGAYVSNGDASVDTDKDNNVASAALEGYAFPLVHVPFGMNEIFAAPVVDFNTHV